MTKIIHHLFNDDQKQHQQVREQLVLSSPELIAVESTSKIKVEDVTGHAQVSRGAFYKCFRSVDDLLNVSAKQAGHELAQPIISAGSTILDIPMRVATKTKMAMRLFSRMPLLARVLLKSEWPFKDVHHKGYKDIKNDVAQGIKQGHFTDMPLEIATNLVISTLRGAVQEMLDSPQPPEYEDQVIYHLLLSLGVDAKSADKISKIPLDQLPDLPKKGLVGRILKLVA
jgi:AcrR family transcriptional regulator